MGLHARILFTAAQKAELWERWKNGQSAAAISRALERRNKTGVERIVVLHGGIAPAPRRRALAAPRLEEREEISRGIADDICARQEYELGNRYRVAQRPEHHDPLNAGLVPPLQRPRDGRSTLPVLPSLPELSLLRRCEPYPCMQPHRTPPHPARLEDVASIS